jgi:hypothetical protein
MLDTHLSEVSIAIRLQDGGKLTAVHTLLPAGQGEMGTKWVIVRSEA